MKRIISFVLIAMLTFMCMGCESSVEVDAGSSLRVVASFYPMNMLLCEIAQGAENLSVSVMASEQGSCLHDYQLSSSDLKGIEGASMFISCGAGMEPFLDKISEQYPELNIVNASEGFDAIENNGHVWLSLNGAAVQARNITDALIAADTDNEPLYRGNLADFEDGTETLRDQAEAVRAETGGKSVILMHEGLEYIAQDLELSVKASTGDDENSPLSAADTAQMISIVRETGAVLLCATGTPESMYRAIVAECDAKVVEINLMLEGEAVSGAYFEAMEQNYARIAEALRE